MEQGDKDIRNSCMKLNINGKNSCGNIIADMKNVSAE